MHRTSVRRVGDEYPSEVELPRGAGGLQVASVANCGEIYTLLKANLDELAAMLGSAQLEQIDRALPTALALRSSP